MPKIYDNIENRLKEGLNKTLEDAKRADFCIGYFNLRVWRLLYQQIDNLSGDYFSKEYDDDTKYHCRITISDCYYLNKPELVNFYFDKKTADLNVLKRVTKNFENDLINKSQRRVYHYKTSGKVEYDEFYLKKSKQFIDQIDTVLAKHYGFTEEELDFIINYDIKYRMGKELDGYIEGTLGNESMGNKE